MTSTDVSGFLAHFGVKGMRWGVHSENDSGSDESSSPHTSSAVHALLKAGGLDALSDAELGRVVEDLRLEKKMAEANPKPFTTQTKSALGYNTSFGKASKLANRDSASFLTSLLLGTSGELRTTHRAFGGKK